MMADILKFTETPIIYIFIITIIMQTYDNSIQSRRKFRVQPLAGEPEKNVIRDGPLVTL